MLTGAAGCRVPRRLQPPHSRSGCRKATCVPHSRHIRGRRHTITHTPEHHHIITHTQHNHSTTRILTGTAGCRVPRRLQPPRSRSGCSEDACAPHKKTQDEEGTLSRTRPSIITHRINASTAQGAGSQVTQVVESKKLPKRSSFINEGGDSELSRGREA